MAKLQQNVTVTKLKKFYSTMNQAVNLSVAANGETQYWVFPDLSEDDPDLMLNSIFDFYNKYFKNYLKVLKIEDYNGNLVLYYADGTGVYLANLGRDWIFCINASDIKKLIDGGSEVKNSLYGRSCFRFGFYPKDGMACYSGSYSNKNFFNKGIEPYVRCASTGEDGSVHYTTADDLYSDPLLYTKLIQINGWEIPKDYPIKF